MLLNRPPGTSQSNFWGNAALKSQPPIHSTNLGSDMAPLNDPGKSDESSPQLRDTFHPAAANDEEESDDDSSDGDEQEGAEPSGYAPLATTPPPPPQNTAGEAGGEEHSPDFEAEEAGTPQQRQQREEGVGQGELNPRVRSLAEADQRAHRREEARERVMVFSGDAPQIGHGLPRTASMEMDAARVESIRRAMERIPLPDSAVPKWAKEMSDIEWQEMVARKLSKDK